MAGLYLVACLGAASSPSHDSSSSDIVQLAQSITGSLNHAMNTTNTLKRTPKTAFIIALLTTHVLSVQTCYPSLLLALHHLSLSLDSISYSLKNLPILQSLLDSHRRHALTDPMSRLLEGVLLKRMARAVGNDARALILREEAAAMFKEVGKWVDGIGGSCEPWVAAHAVLEGMDI
jgi:hypothetical protein